MAKDKKAPIAAVDFVPSSEKVMQTFRMPRDLVTFLKAEAGALALDLTGYVNRTLDGVRTYFGLPAAATTLLEADRQALKMHRNEYLLHVLYQRSMVLREKDPGFDAPGTEREKKKH